jgi:hypothetical protein
MSADCTGATQGGSQGIVQAYEASRPGGWPAFLPPAFSVLPPTLSVGVFNLLH